MAKIPASSLTVFTLDGQSMVTKTNDVSVDIEIATEDGSDINSVWTSATLVGKSWTITGSGLIDTNAYMTGKADTDPIITVAITSGAKTYSGTGIITRTSHSIQRHQNQTESFTIIGQGALTIADPS